MQFEFATANRILFGSGRIQELAGLCRNDDGAVVLITGRTPNRWDAIVEALQREGMPVVTFSIPQEPHISDVRAGARLARDCAAKMVVSIGGGSAIDAGKAISAMAQQPGDVLDYLEVIGQGKPLDTPALHRGAHDSGHWRRSYSQRRSRKSRT